jgi:adenylate kinase
MRILILGPQGSGKGTQAKRIAEGYGMAHVATGDILRAAMADGTDLGRRVKPIYDRGDLVPDDLMIDLIRERLEREEGFVLDGFPRTVPQAEALDSMLAQIGKPLDLVLLLQVGDDVATERLLRRAAEEGRVDDTPEVVRNRLHLYHQQTEPVVERYRAEGTLVPIDGDQTVGAVAADIDDALAHVGIRSR